MTGVVYIAGPPNITASAKRGVMNWPDAVTAPTVRLTDEGRGAPGHLRAFARVM